MKKKKKSSNSTFKALIGYIAWCWRYIGTTHARSLWSSLLPIS